MKKFVLATLLTISACSATGDPHRFIQAEDCFCTGTGPGDVPVTVDCGQGACGSDYHMYACTSGGLVGPGALCGADFGSCTCSGTGLGDVPIVVNCGSSACGSDDYVYSCVDGSWTGPHETCDSDGGGGGGCSCTGTGLNGTVTVACGGAACGSDYILYSCSSGGWSSTSLACGGSFSFNLDSETMPSGIAGSRTGDTVYVARSLGTTAVAVSSLSTLWEERENMHGQWTFWGWTNVITSPNDFLSSWTAYNSPTLTTGQSDPTGGANATLVRDTSTSTVASIYSGDRGSYGHDPTAMVWYKKSTTYDPTGTGLLGVTNGGSGGTAYCGWLRTDVFDASSGWFRAHSQFPTSGAAGPPALLISPSGQTPHYQAYADLTASDVGGLSFWGAQAFGGPDASHPAFDAPLVAGTTSDRVLMVDSNKLGDALDVNGDLDLSGRFYLPDSTGSQNIAEQRVVTVETADGSTRISLAGGISVYAQFNGGTETGATVGNGRAGQIIGWRIFDKPHENAYGYEVSFNGAIAVVDSRTSPGVVGVPASIHLGSDESGAKILPSLHTLLKRSGTSISTIYDVEGVFLGDSTLAAYDGALALVAAGIYQGTDATTRPGILNIAATAERADQQLAKWQVSPANGRASIVWILDGSGINDIAQGASAATVIARRQATVDYINAHNSSAYVIQMPMIPFGSNFTSGQIAIWYTVNDAIEGNGSTPITGSNILRLPLWDALDNGSGYLKIGFLGIDDHDNDAARAIMEQDIHNILVDHSLL